MMVPTLHWTTVVLAAATGAVAGPTMHRTTAPTASTPCHIHTETAMRDEAGQPIYDCLEPHIQRFQGVYYAYGFTVRTPPYQFATTCYSSVDLQSWTKRAHFPINVTDDGSDGQLAIALWYVIYNAKNDEYVGYGGECGKSNHVYTSASIALF